MPKVSVIIPTFNRADYLVQAVKSVLEQTFSDLEVIVVDDGSTDNTSQVIKEWQDSRIRYFRQENAGRSAARNRGIAFAHGAYLAFLDDDDLFLPHKLSRQVDFLVKNKEIDLVAGGAELQNSVGITQTIWRTWELQKSLTLINCLYNCPLIPSTILVRREVFDFLDHWFDAELEPAEDKDFFIRLLYAGYKMSWLAEPLSIYRIHDQNSQGDGIVYSKSYQKLLNKLFARTDVPRELEANKTRLYSHFYVVGALRCYANKQIPAAQNDLIKAMDYDEKLREGDLPLLVERVANFANSFYVTEPMAFIHLVFDNLPDKYGSLRKYRNKALSYFYMQHIFEVERVGNPLRDLVLALWYSPHWLQNRGVWSILIKSVFGSK